MEKEIIINVLNTCFIVRSDCTKLLHRLKNDFYLYVAKSSHTKKRLIQCYRQDKDLGPEAIDFKGRAQVLMNHQTKEAIIASPHLERLHEVTYLYLLSVLGKLKDLEGLHRLHASAISTVGDTAVLFVGKSGMGKSHLAYLLGECTLSDDTPFLKGTQLTPFQIRRGFAEDKALTESDKSRLYELEREEYGLKKLLPMTNQAPRTNYNIDKIFFLREASEVSVRKASLLDRLHDYTRYLLIGEGTPIIFEFFWEPGIKDMLIKTKIFFLRLKQVMRLLPHKNTYVLYTNRSMDAVEALKNGGYV